MKIFDQNDKEIQLEDCDLTIGYITNEIRIKNDATPIDNKTKFAWYEEDYENIKRYIVIPEDIRNENRLNELKNKLSNSDYAIIKIMEGTATTEEYSQLIADRKAWRAEVNKLQPLVDAYHAELDTKYKAAYEAHEVIA